MVQAEMRRWFEAYDWNSPKVNEYLNAELNEETITLYGIDFPELRPPFLPFVRFGPFPRFWQLSIDNEWFDLPVYTRLLSFLDLWFFLFVLYFTFSMAVCISPQGDDLQNHLEDMWEFCQSNPSLNDCALFRPRYTAGE